MFLIREDPNVARGTIRFEPSHVRLGVMWNNSATLVFVNPEDAPVEEETSAWFVGPSYSMRVTDMGSLVIEAR